jgi:hypothetical protein
MSLILRFSASIPSNATIINITDCTSIYSPLNVGGWDTPNVDISTALTATISISKRNTDGTWQTQTSVDVFDDLPSQAGGSVDITAEDAGQGETFSDSILRLIYNVTGDDSGTPYNVSTTIYQAFTPVIDSYRQNLAKDVSACNCVCEELTEKFNCFSGYYRLLCASKRCGDLNGIQKYIDILTTLMGNNCGCGGN